MLHCPRCSGPLQVTPDPDVKSCPAGDCCPHQRLSPPPAPTIDHCAHQPSINPVDSCLHQRLSPINSLDSSGCQHKRHSLPPADSCVHQRLSPIDSCHNQPAINPVDRFLQQHRLSPPLPVSTSDCRQHHRLSLPLSVDHCHQSNNYLSGGGILSDDRSQFLASSAQQNLFSHNTSPSVSSHCCSHPPHDTTTSTSSMLTSHHFLLQPPTANATGFNLHLLPSGQLTPIATTPVLFASTIQQPFNFIHQTQPSIFTTSNTTLLHNQQPQLWTMSRPISLTEQPSTLAPQHKEPWIPVSSISEILHRNMDQLKQCLWYYPSLKWNESSDLLQSTLPGTFLVRDSADQHFLFSLSVQRKTDGPTSIRIHFQQGRFRLDAEESIRHLMPDFSSVVELIDHYSSPKASDDEDEDKRPVWIDNIGKLSSPICLRRPLYKSVPSLAHFSRLAVSRRLHESGNKGKSDELRLPKAMVKFVDEYPHRV